MSFHLPRIRLTEADYVQVFTPGRKYYRIQPTIDKAEGAETPFTVIPALVFENDGLAPIHIDNQAEWQSSVSNVLGVFAVVKGNAH
jgi:hypothetical protein